MNKKLRYIGLLAILPLFLVFLGHDYVSEANADKAEGSPGHQSPKSYGSATKEIVCGDKLCSELEGDGLPVSLVSGI